jgi:hypothetical protein
MLTDEEYSQYCDTMASTPAWGGQVINTIWSNAI